MFEGALCIHPLMQIFCLMIAVDAGEAFERLRTVGTLQMLYKSPFVDMPGEVCFESHKQLDNYVLDLLSSYPLFPKSHPHDWALLKAYGLLSLRNLLYSVAECFLLHRPRVLAHLDR